MNKPLLSIGMIFKNEIRCLERCLKSLQPLRDAIPCELVMADTGSDDGSREVAERYADILFDFPWINDFAAARNAVMDRCSGKWHLTLDADEWLDEDIRELVGFLKEKKVTELCAGVIIRNYRFQAGGDDYTEFMGIRVLRMSTDLRYEGKIHEHWSFGDKRTVYAYPLRKTVLHHDGYIVLNDGSAAGIAKRKRNMELLMKELEEHPDDLRTLIQCIESSDNNEDTLSYVRRGLELLEGKKAEERGRFGANLMSHAVHIANKMELPEFQEWVSLAEKEYPNSTFTMVDVQLDAVNDAWVKMDCPEIIYRSKRYLEGLRKYRAGQFAVADMLQSPLRGAGIGMEISARIWLAQALIYEDQPEEALKTLEGLDYSNMVELQARILFETILRLHTLSEVDTSALLRHVWEKINEPNPSEEEAKKRWLCFAAISSWQFMPQCMEGETKRMIGEITHDGVGEMRPEEWNVFKKHIPCRYGYTLFKPLAGETEVGTAAVLMDETDVEAATRLLKGVKRFEELPIRALSRALVRGVHFPLEEHPLNIEEMDSLAARLTQDKEALRTLVERAAAGNFAESWQTLQWTSSLVMAAIQICEWEDETRDMELAKIFAKVEGVFLPAYYSPEILQEDAVRVLPAMHRAGWYCARAFAALEAGDTAGYVRNLREGLSLCENMKSMVEFLTEHTPELQPTPMNPELLELADRVRALLASYPPDDPMVEALKASPAYQSVAHLIEGPEPGMFGGLAQ